MKKEKIISLVIALLFMVGVVYFFVFFDRTPPSIELPQKKYFNMFSKDIIIKVKDKDSPLRRIQVSIIQGKRIKTTTASLTQKKTKEYTYIIPLKKLSLKQGNFIVEVRCWDASPNNFFQGNEAVKKASYTLDTLPPTITLHTYRHYVKIGGAGVCGFSISEPVSKVGVIVHKSFFPAYPYLKKDLYCCFFGIPYFLKRKDVTIVIYARDRAGNVAERPLPFYLQHSSFSSSKIDISDSFLKAKMVQFQPLYKGLTPIEIFLKVNKELRKKDRERLKEIGRDTADKIMWKGAFLRLPHSARKASFGIRRAYFYHGEKIDEETHLGVDLASIARSPIPAANSGRVIFTGWYDIYGNAVIIDHGFGLQSLYGHLSRIKVKVGELVKKGEIIGNTGATGLAGGDHLHFAILISGMPVNPVEWWDINWIKNNILYNLKQMATN